MLKKALINAAAELWSGGTIDDMSANPEYLRGQVELICTLLEIDLEYKDDIEGEIVRAVLYR